MDKYNPQEIEPKWQKYWEENNFYEAEDFSHKPKKYILIEFPYPSGDGLHVGHVRSYTALDAIARQKRMAGYNVLFPIGWDAFGLPTENYALKTGIHPQKATKKNIATFKRQIKSLGLSFDWLREINTTDPKYYKWTQWIFLKLFEKGLAYQTEMPINFCPSCKIGLANEEVIAGNCERCSTKVEKKALKQWMLKITAYADRLINGLKNVDYPERVKAQQINWIGKSYGTEIDFKVQGFDKTIKVFTTRTDTLFGATAVVLAPENPLVAELIIEENKEKAEKYIKEAKNKSDFEREKLEKEKTGVFTGTYCLNPINNEKVPIWIGDYVVASYGGGAVMMVPAHDYRDYDFAEKYGLLKKCVIEPPDILVGVSVLGDSYEDARKKTKEKKERILMAKEPYVQEGILINSEKFSGLSSKEAIEKITKELEKKKSGRKLIQYKLRDWVFSRQHYWGEPIPIIHCEKCGVVPVPEKDLPVELPYIEKYQPSGTGESPLANIADWVDVKCPKCKGAAKRETDTMPNWAGSNWYFMRYADPQNDKALADKKNLKYWMPVDWYNGGMEHTTLHLLYSRFIYKFLFDIKVVPGSEPYQKRTSQGMVLAEDNRKMSKSFSNVINPDSIVKEYGADTLRCYEMFMGPFDQSISWNVQGVKGVSRFLDRVWNLFLECSRNEKTGQEVAKATYKLNKKIDKDLEMAKFNTIIAGFMELMNLVQANKKEVGRDALEKILIMLFPFAPHIAEELWQRMGRQQSISLEKWPQYTEKLTADEKATLIIQINGRVRDKIEVKAGISQKEAERLTLAREKVKKWILGREIKKVIFVPNKIINIVV